MCNRLEEINPDANLTPQSLEERINKKETVEYIKTVFTEAMNQKIADISLNTENLLSSFTDVELQDSTVISLNEKLSDTFPGSGGNASGSALKVDLVYSIKNCKLKKLSICNGTHPDQLTSRESDKSLPIGGLQICDLGYFTLHRFKLLDNNEKYYLSRLHTQVNVYLFEDAKETIDLPDYLNKYFKHQNVIDITVYVGAEERLPTRLIVYRLKEEIVSERRRKAYETARRKGRTPTKKHLAFLEFSSFITNVPVQILC